MQFGLAYGIAGRRTPVPEEEVRSVLNAAWRGGIRLLDTAPAYGDIEQRLAALAGAHAFQFVSKIPALTDGADASRVAEAVATSVRTSRERLGTGLAVLLFHRGEDLCDRHGEVAWRAATDAIAGTAIRLGGSFYSPAAAAVTRARFPLAVAQLPGNVLDQRLASASERLADVEIHLRSVFLQGLLLNPPHDTASRVPKAAEPLAAWQAWCAEQCVPPLSAALGVARALPRVRVCIAGVDSLPHLENILVAWREAPPLMLPGLACTDEDVIDPRRWKAA